jgi:hypothetical protein
VARGVPGSRGEVFNKKGNAMLSEFDRKWTEKVMHLGGGLRRYMPAGFPEIVCLCGSTKFIEAWQKANLEETLAGRIVLSIVCNTKSDADLQRMGELSAEKKIELDELQKRKIDLCDGVLVLNVGGYIGYSTRNEIEYATAAGKRIRYLEKP